MLLQNPFDKVTFYVTSACASGASSAHPQTTAEDMTMVMQTFQTRLKKLAHTAASAWLAGQADAGIAKAKCRHGPIMTKYIAFACDFTSTAAAASASDVTKTANSPSALPAGPISKMTSAKFKYTKEHLESLWFRNTTREQEYEEVWPYHYDVTIAGEGWGRWVWCTRDVRTSPKVKHPTTVGNSTMGNSGTSSGTMRLWRWTLLAVI
jgi:hypothetical protein